MITILYTMKGIEYDYIRVARLGRAARAYLKALRARGATNWKVRTS